MFRQHNIWRARQIAAMKTKAQSGCVQCTPYVHFRRCILTRDAGHCM